MAHIDDNSGGRKSSFDVNIVPFIDLMSVLIIFLLFTAVWSQVSMIQIGSSLYSKKTSAKDSKPPPIAEIPFRLDIKPTGYQILLGRQVTQIPKIASGWNIEKLRSELKAVKEFHPEKQDCVVTMNDELAYVELIHGMDALLAAGFPEISIATGGAQ
jgi:biopolymer transport protein TolR